VDSREQTEKTWRKIAPVPAATGALAALLTLGSAINHGYSWFYEEPGSHAPAARKPDYQPLPPEQRPAIGQAAYQGNGVSV
jgi:hypothetical protein